MKQFYQRDIILVDIPFSERNQLIKDLFSEK